MRNDSKFQIGRTTLFQEKIVCVRKVNHRIGLTILAVLLSAAPLFAERLPLKPYTVADGLPSNQINKIVRDSRGFLWFCTAEGLSRFDGYEFKNYDTAQGLPHPYVNDFLETKNGELWVATNNGVVRFNPRGKPGDHVVPLNAVDPKDPPLFSVLIPPDEDRRGRLVNVLFEDHEGSIWLGMYKGLLQLKRPDQNSLQPLVLPLPGDQPFIYDLIEDQNNSLWIATDKGLFRRWPTGNISRYTKQDGLPDELVQDLLLDDQGRLWGGTRYGGLFLFGADQTAEAPLIKRKLTNIDGLNTPWVNQIFETSDHRYWIATDKGIAEFFPDAQSPASTFKSYTQVNGLIFWTIGSFSEDASGNLWIASGAGGMKLARNGFVTYGERDGLLAAYSIFPDKTGAICFRGSVYGDEISSVFESAKPDLSRPFNTYHTRYGRYDGNEFSWFRPNVFRDIYIGWVGEMVSLQTKNGEWWLGTGNGLYRFPPTDNFSQIKGLQPISIFIDKDGLANKQIFRIFEDSQNNIWASGIEPNGVARWERASETWHNLSDVEGLPSPGDDLARSFGEDAAGSLWIGFSTGVSRYREGKFTFFNSASGVPVGSIQNIFSDSHGRLWLTSSRSGLIKVDYITSPQPVFTAYTTTQGLSSNSAQGITEDSSGFIYVGTGRGLDRLDPNTGHIKHFTAADGLAPGGVIAGFRDNSGELWFGTANGLSRFDSSTTNTVVEPPPILITDVSIAGEQQIVSATGETNLALADVSADRNQLHVSFVGVAFSTGEVLKYQYKLEGADRDWSLPTEQRTLNFERLAPGQYTFYVRAVNSDGVASVAPATVTFRVLAPVWQRWWFIAFLLILTGAVAGAVYRYRVSRLLEVANMRTRIATDLHDDIGANLTKIAILSEVARQQLGDVEPDNGDSSGTPLSSIARISRESVAAMGDIVWAINPERDHMIDLVRRMRQHAEELFTVRDIKLDFKAPSVEENLRLGADTRRDLLLIFKEAVNNAARHSGCSEVAIVLQINRTWLSLEISDDGFGFDPALESEGQGLLSMRRRAVKLGGKLEFDSRKGSGTKVTLRIPVGHQWFPTAT